MIVTLTGHRHAPRHDVAVLHEELAECACVVPPCLQRFDVRLARRWQHLAIGRSPVTVFVRETSRGKERPPAAAVPEEPRPDHRALVPGEVGPRIVVDVGRLLPVTAAEERRAPALPGRRRQEHHGVCSSARRSVQEKFLDGLVGRPPRQQIDDAAHRASSVERRCHALDDFDLSQVHGRNLKQAEASDFTEERQTIREHSRVPAAHALDPDARGAERRRRGLHAHAAHLVQHHDDVTGRHEHLLFDLFARQHFDAHGLILEPLVGSGRRHDGHGFLDGRLRLQVHDHVLDRSGGDRHADRDRSEAGLHDGDADRSGARGDRDRSGCVGTVGSPGHDDLGIRDGLSGRTHLDANGSGRSLSGSDGRGRTDDQSDRYQQ